MAINLGTTNAPLPFHSSNQRKLVKTDLNKLVLFHNFYYTGGGVGIEYKTSTDGITWDVSWTSITITHAFSYDVYIDTNNDIYIVYDLYDADGIYFIKLTYDSGTQTWSTGSPVTVTTLSGRRGPCITKRSNGDLWVGTCREAYSTIQAFYSTDIGTNWTASTIISVSYTTGNVGIIPVGTDIWFIVQCGSRLRYVKYTTSWGSVLNIVTSGISSSDISVLKISDSDIWIATVTASGIRVFRYTTIWDTGTLITSGSNDNYPCICNINSKPQVIYSIPGISPYKLNYVVFDGSSWGTAITILSDTNRKGIPVGLISSTQLYFAWADGNSTPRTIYFDTISTYTSKTILSDSKIKAEGYQKTILSDSKIKIENIQETILSDSEITESIRKTIISDASILDIGVGKTILSDSKIKIENIQETVLADSKMVDRFQKTILSDSKIKARIQKTILSNAKISIQILYDIINKITIAKQSLYSINNKFTSVIRVLSDVSNFINTCISIISDARNDFRTKKLMINNITNDVRFLYSWQKASDGSIQSLGKEYIKVYIGGIEQTDVDVDSISISKDLSSSHTATFELGREYDSTKPSMESTVTIKYNNWILYSGYVTQISPADGPEKIRINCQNEYWKQNKENVYYHVGHTPSDDKELYYNTLASALTVQHGWTPGPGTFIPEVLSNFAVGKSDAISNLVKEMGNYEWFYDVDTTKKLWIAGNGAIIDLERQSLGKNINLYSVINHSFDESAENIINKFRVQMGNKIVRKFDSTGGSRVYAGYNRSSFHGFLTPAWNQSFEKRAAYSSNGYGYDYPEPGYETEYDEVFKKYRIPYLDPEISSWSDTYPPKIVVYRPGGYYYKSSETLLEGFSIDYENRIITFNAPMFSQIQSPDGKTSAVRAPTLELYLYKRDYYTYTADPSENPETDISNPMMFFTDKKGIYPDTIIKDLNLSNLSIQIGGTTLLPDGTTELVPSWDDTEFAKDFANWELSKSCDKKIRGTIDITLDAMCFYNIDLTKRIYISGITTDAMNIVSINYNMSNFTVSLSLESLNGYSRSVSYQSHGE